MTYLSKIMPRINKDEFAKIRERYKSLRRTNEISALRKTLELDRIQKSFNSNQETDATKHADSPRIKELRRILLAMEKADAELDDAESGLLQMERLVSESERLPAKTVGKEELIAAQQTIKILEKKLQQREEDYKKITLGKSNGGNQKNKKTNDIKHHVIKPIFTAKKQTGKLRKISEIADSIEKELQDLEMVNFEAFAKKYSIADLTHLEDAVKYLSSREDGGQISEWCYQISKGKF